MSSVALEVSRSGNPPASGSFPPSIREPFAWERSYPPEGRWDVEIVPGTLTALLDSAITRYSARAAIMFRDVTLTYAELGERSEAFARALIALGVEPGDRIALYLPNTPDHPIAFFGALRIGATLVHLSPLDGERVLAHKLADSGAKLVVTTDLKPMLTIALGLFGRGLIGKLIVCGDGRWGQGGPSLPIPADAGILAVDLLPLAPRPAAWPEVAPSHIALLQYTGGTTGLPKGAILTHGNLTAAVGQYQAWFRAQGLENDLEERVIGVLPLFHIYALTTILLRQLVAGKTILLHQRFDVETILNDIERKRASQFAGVPTMWIALANYPGIETRDLSSLKQVLSGGASLPVEVAARFKQLTGFTLRGGWGMTETSPAGTRIPETCEDKPGTIGIPIPGVELDVVALDDPRRRLGIGEVGEIRVRGPNVTSGYWNRPEETAAAFVDGYLLTGDVGYMDEDGFFFIVDRRKDMIISGGFNVYPQLIEQAIYEHEAVAEVLVIGVPDAYRGETAKAFVALRPGFPTVSLDELRTFLKNRLGPHELPTALEFRDALPRTPVGKLSKLDLKAEVGTSSR